MLQNPDRMDRKKDRLNVCAPWHALSDCGTCRQSLQTQKRPYPDWHFRAHHLPHFSTTHRSNKGITREIGVNSALNAQGKQLYQVAGAAKQRLERSCIRNTGVRTQAVPKPVIPASILRSLTKTSTLSPAQTVKERRKRQR